jgi:hypothetical protein
MEVLMEKTCVVCGGIVDWDYVVAEMAGIFEHVDHLGVDALTENEQAVYEGRVCSWACYEELP